MTGRVSPQVKNQYHLRIILQKEKFDKRESIGWATKRGGPALYSNRVVSTPFRNSPEGLALAP